MIDFDAPNLAAAKWARERAGGLIKNITTTTRDQVREAVAEWVQEGQPLGALRRNLQRIFDSRRRAQLIAQTETTAAYAEGNLEAWRQSDVVKGARWNTVQDERVCPICAPLDNQEGALGDIGGYWPPAHPGCRCFVSPVVSKEKMEKMLLWPIRN